MAVGRGREADARERMGIDFGPPITLRTRLTDRARLVVRRALVLAHEAGDEQARPEHVLMAMLHDGVCSQGVGGTALRARGLTEAKLRELLTSLAPAVDPGRRTGNAPASLNLPWAAAQRVVAAAAAEARSLDHLYIGTEHLLLGVLCNPDPMIGAVMRHVGIEEAEVRDAIVAFLHHDRPLTQDCEPPG